MKKIARDLDLSLLKHVRQDKVKATFLYSREAHGGSNGTDCDSFAITLPTCLPRLAWEHKTSLSIESSRKM